MARFLAYAPPAAGHVFPLVPGLLALQARGHTVQLRTGAGMLGVVRAAGLDAEPTDPAIEDVPVNDDVTARPVARLRRSLRDMLGRAELELADLRRAVGEFGPDVLLVDTNKYGAAVAAEASGLPWAIALPSLLALPGKGIPPYGLGLAPMRGPAGAVRDGLLWPVVVRQYGRAMLPRLNALRAGAGLRELRSPVEHVLAPDRLLVMTGQPLEYPRRDLPGHVRFVGAQLWEPPSEAPAWLLEEGAPWVLVTLSTDYQHDEQLAVTAIEALRDEPVRVVITLADAHGVAELPPAANVRLERFLPHGAVLERAVAVVSPGGMGIVQKALAAGVPMVAVPFGRDQPEVSRRVVEAGAGVRVLQKELSAGGLRAAVREAIGMRAAAEAAGARLRAAGGPDDFADTVEELAPAAVEHAPYLSRAD